MINGTSVIKGPIALFFLGGAGSSAGFIQRGSTTPSASQENLRCGAAVSGINNTQIRVSSGPLPPSCWTHTTHKAQLNKNPALVFKDDAAAGWTPTANLQ